jgi:carbonic anhydrase/acetyltransferase-like protein (isoleucine patch superfamily)
MPVYAFENHRPIIAATTYVSPSAQIIGKVAIGERCYIGHGAILRGDFGSIEIGDEPAIEEGIIVHSRPEERTPIHNATVEDGAVIGMRAVVSDYAEVGDGSIVGEMALVKNHQKILPGKVAVGVPVRIVGNIDERHDMMTHTAKSLYVELARRYAEGAMVEIAPPWPGAGSNRDA